jgi:hypothetical protein
MNSRVFNYLCVVIFILGLTVSVMCEEEEPKRGSALLSRYGRAVLSRYGKRSGFPLMNQNKGEYDVLLCRKIYGDMMQCIPQK